MQSYFTKRAAATVPPGISVPILSWISILCLLLGLALGWGIHQFQQDEIAHIQTGEVFAAFAMAQELDAKLQNTRQSRETILETMKLRLQQMEAQKTSLDSLQSLAQQFRQKSEQFAADNQHQSQQYTDQIWTQLNQYIQEYCEEEGISYLLGATGNGNLMGASAEQDVTQEVIEYVNRKYQDG